jgi:hypothetical protein
MKKQEELVIITKTYDLILWSCNHTGRFPRQHRFVLGERLERTRRGRDAGFPAPPAQIPASGITAQGSYLR